MEIKKLITCFEYIYKRVSENPRMLEDELYEVIINSNFFAELGYETFGKDVRAQRVIPETRKKADYVCYDEYLKAIFVLEAKPPSHKTLSDALPQLWNRYVLPLKSQYGVLTNGWELIVYKRILNNPDKILKFNLGRANQEICDKLFRLLKKPTYDFTIYSNVEKYFKNLEPVSLKSETSKEDFLKAFKLGEDSQFSALVKSLSDLFELIYPNSKFLKAAYGYWRKNLSQKPKDVPDSWKPFINDESDVFRFMFCLETGHVLLSRFIIAKVCEDLGFLEEYDFEIGQYSISINISRYILREIHNYRGQIPIVSYPLVLDKLIIDMREYLVESIFEDDIFDWWKDALIELRNRSAYDLLQETIDKHLENFSEIIAKFFFLIVTFDFSEISGDPLGDLYQQYFDRSTRKALGEFYTPIEIVNYILDAVGYNNIGNKQLLDPACGSGTFIGEALKRYLRESKREAKEVGWVYVLRELCNSTKILGFDIHPFACLMTRTRFLIELIPYYIKALKEDKDFYIRRLPIFRTDSLKMEIKSDEFDKQTKLIDLKEDLRFNVEVPVIINENTSVSIEIILPSWRKMTANKLKINNIDEYFSALQAMFNVSKKIIRLNIPLIREELITEQLGAYYLHEKDYFSRDNIGMFLQPYAEKIIDNLRTLKSEYGDGRLIKSIEDSVLSSILKNYFQYDFIVGNPPYVRQEKITEYKERLEIDYPEVYDGRADLYVYFFKKGIDMLKTNGKLGFISSNKFIKRGYGKKLRNFILKETEITQIIDFGDSGVFKDVINYPCIIILNKRLKTDLCQLIMHAEVFSKPKDVDGKLLLNEISNNIIRETEIETEFYSINRVEHPSYLKRWILAPLKSTKVIEKIRTKANYLLGEICEKIFMCAQSNADSVHIVSKQKIRELKLEEALLKPLVRGEQVKRWKITWEGLYILYPHRRKGKKVISIPSKEMKENYPNIWKYLNIEENKKKLIARDYLMDKIRDGSRQEWYELWIPKQPEWFEQPKIFTPDISKTSNFAFDADRNFYAPTTVYGIILKKNMKKHIYYLYLLGLLNSHVLEFYFKHLSPFLRGRYYRYNMQFLELLPIKLPFNLNEELPQKIIQKVKGILKKIELQEQLEKSFETYLNEYRLMGIEFDVTKCTFKKDHIKLRPIIVDSLSEGLIIYPNKGEDQILVDTKEKANYIVFSLRDKKVKKDETIEIIIPRDNIIVNEFLDRIKKAEQELKEISITQLENDINKLVYKLYEINKDEQIIIENFLSNRLVSRAQSDAPHSTVNEHN